MILSSFLRRFIVALSLFAVSISSALAASTPTATFNNLSNYQKQKYWQYMRDCQPLLQAGNNSGYQTCAKDVINKAYNAKESDAWCVNSNTGPVDYFHKGIITSDLYPNGKEDYIYTSPNGKSYLMKGFCSSFPYPHYSYYQKNCAEFGKHYYADAALGSCAIKNSTPAMKQPTAMQVNEGAEIKFTVAATDADNDPLSYEVSGLPTGATFNQQTGVFNFSPSFDFVTSPDTQNVVTTQFRATDGMAFSSWISVAITVKNINRAPVLSAVAAQTVDEGAVLKFVLAGSDPDGDTLTYQAQGLPTEAQLNGETGEVTFSALYNFVVHPATQKAVTFQIQSSDGTLFSPWITVNMTVNDENQVPVIDAVADQTVDEGQALNFSVTGADPDNDPIMISTQDLPQGASFQDGTFSWTPEYGQNGSYAIIFQVSDGVVLVSKTINITVTKLSCDSPLLQDKGAWSSATSLTNAPAPRYDHSAVWTGEEMIVWGGIQGGGVGPISTGYLYNPKTDIWIKISDPPVGFAPRYYHAAVWTGTEMLIFGGLNDSPSTSFNSGALYDPKTDSWKLMSMTNAPQSRYAMSYVWTGTKLIAWGGTNVDPISGEYIKLNDGAVYDSITDEWKKISDNNFLEARQGATAVWTGTEMIVWGGSGNGFKNDGARYNESTDTWTQITLQQAPQERVSHAAVWTGQEMIIWGGLGGDYLNDGAKYDPSSDTWEPTAMRCVPIARYGHTTIWTGNEMIIWGGWNPSQQSTDDPPYSNNLNSGGKYNPTTDTWINTTLTNAPFGRQGTTAVWTGDEMAVWGGVVGGMQNGILNTGGLYSP